MAGRRRGSSSSWQEQLLRELPPSSAGINRHLIQTPARAPASAKTPRPPRSEAAPEKVAVGDLILGVDGGYATCGWGIVERTKEGVRHLAHGAESEAPGQGRDPLQRALRMARRAAERAAAVTQGRSVLVVVERWNPRLDKEGSQVEAHRVGLGAGAIAAWIAATLGGRASLGRGPAGNRAALGLSASCSKASLCDRVVLLLRLAAPPTPTHAADALAVATVAALGGVTPA